MIALKVYLLGQIQKRNAGKYHICTFTLGYAILVTNDILKIRLDEIASSEMKMSKLFCS